MEEEERNTWEQQRAVERRFNVVMGIIILFALLVDPKAAVMPALVTFCVNIS